MLLVSSCVPVITWLCSRVMQFQSRPINWPLLTIESPVAQWLEHLTRSRGVWVQIPSGARMFSEFSKHLIYHVFVVSSSLLLLIMMMMMMMMMIIIIIIIIIHPIIVFSFYYINVDSEGLKFSCNKHSNVFMVLL